MAEEKVKRVVVAELPQVQVRKAKDEDGKDVELITIEEALTELLNR
jgi:hypothetical protein